MTIKSNFASSNDSSDYNISCDNVHYSTINRSDTLFLNTMGSDVDTTKMHN